MKWKKTLDDILESIIDLSAQYLQEHYMSNDISEEEYIRDRLRAVKREIKDLIESKRMNKWEEGEIIINVDTLGNEAIKYVTAKEAEVWNTRQEIQMKAILDLFKEEE